MSTRTVLDRGLIVIPKPIRDEFKLAKGDKVEITSSPEGILIKPLKGGTLTEQYRGVVKGGLGLEELEELYAER